ncbi:MAG: hypothetical protein HGB26_00510 [Desulfobulbaceae bacterium]|nr:hypothetical protein [Desulfobulbaceae bacterium]
MTQDNNSLPTNKNIEDYKLLRDLLLSQRKEFDILSKKKADGQLNSMKIKMVNRVLEPLKELFTKEESFAFLDILNEDEMPTYSDVVLIISQFETAISEFKIKYYLKDLYLSSEYSPRFRWMTEECPPDYYSDHEDENSFDDEKE